MQCCVIYNKKSGEIYNIIYNSTEIPEGFEDTSMILDIPEGCNLMSLDVSEDTPKPNYNYWPAIDLDSVRAQVKNNSTEIQTVYDVVNQKTDTNFTDTIVEELISIDSSVCLMEIGG